MTKDTDSPDIDGRGYLQSRQKALGCTLLLAAILGPHYAGVTWISDPETSSRLVCGAYTAIGALQVLLGTTWPHAEEGQEVELKKTELTGQGPSESVSLVIAFAKSLVLYLGVLLITAAAVGAIICGSGVIPMRAAIPTVHLIALVTVLLVVPLMSAASLRSFVVFMLSAIELQEKMEGAAGKDEDEPIKRPVLPGLSSVCIGTARSALRSPLGDQWAAAVALPAAGTLLGTFLGTFAVPLDWGTVWQVYPIPVMGGAVIGHTLGLSLCMPISAWRYSGSGAPAKLDEKPHAD